MKHETTKFNSRVKGIVIDPQKQVNWVLNGTWDDKMEMAPVISTEGSLENPIYRVSIISSYQLFNCSSGFFYFLSTNIQTGNYKTIWKRKLPPTDCDRYYNFTEFACQLNEEEQNVAPTDSRVRPDQRLMENARWDESNSEKLR